MPGLLVIYDGGVIKAIHDDDNGGSALSYHVSSASAGYFFVEDGHFADLEEIQGLVDQAGVPLYELAVQLSPEGSEVSASASIAGNFYAEDVLDPPFDMDILTSD